MSGENEWKGETFYTSDWDWLLHDGTVVPAIRSGEFSSHPEWFGRKIMTKNQLAKMVEEYKAKEVPLAKWPKTNE